jgi:hypothetical protein
MSFYTQDYTLLQLLAATLAGFVTGRVTAALANPRRREERRRKQT